MDLLIYLVVCLFRLLGDRSVFSACASRLQPRCPDPRLGIRGVKGRVTSFDAALCRPRNIQAAPGLQANPIPNRIPPRTRYSDLSTPFCNCDTSDRGASVAKRHLKQFFFFFFFANIRFPVICDCSDDRGAVRVAISTG